METKPDKVGDWDKTERHSGEKRKDSDRESERDWETEGKGVSVERIYEWGLSLGYESGPSVVHFSVIFTAPQAPMCLPVGAMYTHAQPCMHTYAVQTCILHKTQFACICAIYVLQKNPVTTITHLVCQWAVIICVFLCFYLISNLGLSVWPDIWTCYLTFRFQWKDTTNHKACGAQSLKIR